MAREAARRGQCPSNLKTRDFTDGLSNTLAFSEMRAYERHYRHAAKPGELAIPTDPSEICGLGGRFMATGHTEWMEGRAVQIGFPTTFAPNTKVLCDNDGTEHNVDWTNHQMEGGSVTVKT
jgi:hypothetical protein